MSKKRTKAQKIHQQLVRKQLQNVDQENVQLHDKTQVQVQNKVETNSPALNRINYEPIPTPAKSAFQKLTANSRLITGDLLKTSLVSILIVGILVLVYYLSF